ncbi:MAG: hypothetical protein J5643_03805 [Lachnospiraceae bacterium]|nr:hypothetical protein [Lachnospiraceae bacterium]
MRNVLVGALVVVMIGIGAFAFVTIWQKQKDMKSKMFKEQDERNQAKETYLNQVDALMSEFEPASEVAVKQCETIETVWKNVINKKNDPATDPFTKDENGQFYENYADALAKLQEDPEFAARQKLLEAKEALLKQKYEAITECPADCSVIHTSLLECCTSFSEFAAYATTNPSGSALLYHSNWSGAKSKFDAAVSMSRFSAENVRKMISFSEKAFK